MKINVIVKRGEVFASDEIVRRIKDGQFSLSVDDTDEFPDAPKCGTFEEPRDLGSTQVRVATESGRVDLGVDLLSPLFLSQRINELSGKVRLQEQQLIENVKATRSLKKQTKKLFVIFRNMINDLSSSLDAPRP